MLDIYFIAICIISFATLVVFYFPTKEIQFYGSGTDNHIIAQAASHSDTWKWPSDMHTFGMKTYMKDTVILFLIFFQKLFKGNRSDHSLVMMSGFMYSVSAILIYIIGKNYWDPKTSFFISIIYIFSVWGWQMALFGTHVLTANALFLVSVYCILTNNFIWLFLSGICFGFTMFSSPSARKYIILFIAALFYSKYLPLIHEDQYREIIKILINQNLFLFNIITALIFIFASIASLIISPKIISLMYSQNAPDFFNKIIEGRDKFSLDYYIKLGRKRLLQIIKRSFLIFTFFIATINILGLSILFPVGLGFLVTTLFFTAPNFKSNIYNYFFYYNGSKSSKGRFVYYPRYFARIGKPLPFSPIKRSGWDWVLKFFFRIVPVATIGYFAGLLYMVVYFVNNKSSIGMAASLMVFALSVSPVAWGELTKGPQIGRSYFPGFIGMILFIGYVMYNIPSQYFLPTVSFSIIALGISSWQKFFQDILPSRLASNLFINKLKKMGIHEFYTYNNAYNNAFLNNIDPEILKNYKIHFINEISEVGDGWIAIPGTSSKAFNMESEMEEIANGDYIKDSQLNKLIISRQIENVSEAKFKTFGTSKIWVHESEITSYRDLILHEISDNDRYRAHAWLLHSSKLKKII